MSKRLKVELTCPTCNEKYLKDKSEYIRNLQKNRISYCSLSCSAKASYVNKLPLEKKGNYDISKHCNNNKDEYTDFKYVFAILKRRMRKECNVSLHDLKEIWEYQKGICPYTGIQLKLITHGYKFQDISDERFEIASLDRIDSSKGYEKGNLCFVSIMVNFMKNNMSVESTVKFLFKTLEFLKDKKDNDIVCAVKKFTEI